MSDSSTVKYGIVVPEFPIADLRSARFCKVTRQTAVVYTKARDPYLQCVRSLYWLVTDQYELFVRGQPQGARLTPELWAKLQAWLQAGTVLKQLQAAVAFTAIRGLGKLKPFRMDLPRHVRVRM